MVRLDGDYGALIETRRNSLACRARLAVRYSNLLRRAPYVRTSRNDKFPNRVV